MHEVRKLAQLPIKSASHRCLRDFAYLHDVAFVFSVVKDALDVVVALGTVDDDGKGVHAACHAASEHVG